MRRCEQRMNIFKLLFGLKFLLQTASVCSGSVGGGAADMTRLLKTILNGHKSSVLPRVNQSHPVNVYIGMGVLAVIDLDTKTQVLTMTAFLKMSWRDATLTWTPDVYGNVTSVLLTQDDMWTPDIAVINSLTDNIFPGNSGVQLKLSYDGWVHWVPVFNTQIYCQVDSIKYPNDEDTCVIKLGSWMYDDTQVHVEHLAGHTRLDPNVTNGQFHLEITDPGLTLEERGGLLYSSLHFSITLSRRPGYTFLSLLLPMFIIGLLTVLSFAISADDDEKVDMSLNVMLSTTMFLSVIHDDLPDRSDSIATVAIYVIALFMMSFLGVVGNVIVVVMNQREQTRAEDDELRKSRDNSKDKKFSPTFTRKSFAPSLRTSASVLEAEMTLDPDQSGDVSAATHSVLVVPSSQAAKLNFLFLIFSALYLFIFSLLTFVRIFY